jgi:Type I phosphodiesterase / nucleotide pyrophosphatase
MWLDDLFLRLQRGLDRLIRRVRVGVPLERTRRRFIVIQIDGLSATVLDQALAEGRMPFLRGLLGRHGYGRQPMAVGLPTSTPAFQMAVMYGVRPDIPGYHYHDKRRGMDIHFPRAGHADLVETEQAGGRLGVLRGGSAYGCVFPGGADNEFFNLARLSRPTGHGLLRVLSGFVVIGWVSVKSLYLTLEEFVRACLRVLFRPWALYGHWQLLLQRVGIAVWVRELFTLAVGRDLEAGVPAVYVNFLDYDVAAHAFGPKSRRALRSLKPVDASIRQICRVLRRVPEHQYDVYILADHGQADCIDFRTLSGGQRLERLLFDELIAQASSRRPSGERPSSVA